MSSDILKTNSDMPGVRTWLGILYYKLGRKDDARREWEKASVESKNDLAAKAYLKLTSDWSPENSQ